MKKEEAAMKQADAKPKGTKITLGDSEFGSMLFGSDKQGDLHLRERLEEQDGLLRECAEAWPPVFTKGKPRAGDGVEGVAARHRQAP